MLTHRNQRFKQIPGLAALAAAAFMLGSCATPPSAQIESSLSLTSEAPADPSQQTAIAESGAIPEADQNLGETAVSIDQVAGVWSIRLLGGGEGDDGLLTFTSDGTFSIDGTSGHHAGMNLGFGTIRFEDDLLILESDQCPFESAGSVTFEPCTGIYRVSVSMNDGKPAVLRFTAIDDPFGDRKLTLTDKPLNIYAE